MSLSAGERLGPYEILAPIGKGGMGEVWKARDTRLNRIVAVKRLKGQHSARFEQEARAIAALNHPHICQIFDIGPDYLVLEYIEGQPLKGPQALEEAVRLAGQIAEALDAAHRKGVVHRDLKPANIMVTSEGSVKLLDFGLAKHVTDSDETLTIEGTVMGTAAYMAPEQAEGKPLDARSDVFSFGAVLYELLSGRRAFRGENSVSTMAAILHKEPALLDAPTELQGIVKRCLAKPPAERFQTMAELRAALERIRVKPAGQQPSIAVLPFANMSGDKEQEYFSDGLAEEIINALAQIPGLKVIARTSAFAFRGKDLDIRKIAEALGVATILEGSVRRAGSRVRITAQLISAADGSHLWSQRYDREMADVFAVQDEVAAAIAGVLQTKLAPDQARGVAAAPRHHIPKPEAHEAYLKARYHQWKVTPENLARAKEYYEQAIALDPDFALGHVGCADWFLLQTLFVSGHQVMLLVREAAQRALDLDPALPEANAMMGIVAGAYEFDWKEAERRFRLALARDPVPPLVRSWNALFYLVPTGQRIEAVEEQRRALQQDPLNVQFRNLLGTALIAAGKFPEAEYELRQVLEIDQSYTSYLMLSVLSERRGDFPEALQYAERARSVSPWFSAPVGCLASILKRMGNAERAQELLQKLREGDEHRATLGLFIFHLASGEPDQAADWFEKIVEQRLSPAVFWLRLAQALCPSPRWAAVAKKMNLPE
jgi:TolB-like protein/tRNA A-37 threonylcarbamoyl transferase component Bud32/Tfp pilus assembly protein PilF